MPQLHLLAILCSMKNKTRKRELLLNLGIVLGLILVNLSASQAQPVDLRLPDLVMTSNYSTYQINDNSSTHPGWGLRYSVKQDWFLFGETHHAYDIPLSQETPLFDPNQRRTILIGGGIYF